MPLKRTEYGYHSLKSFRYRLMVVLVSLIVTGSVMSQEAGLNAGGDADWSIVYTGEITGKGSRSLGRKIGDLILGSSPVVLNKPVNIALHAGTPWILNQGEGTVVRMKKDMPEVPPAIRKQKMKFPSLAGITVTDRGQIIFTDSRLNKVYCLSPDGKSLRELNPALVLDQPTGIAYSSARNEIWIVETASHRITVTDAEGRMKLQTGKRGTGPGEFNYPTSVWIDDKGTAYVTDALNFRIQILGADGRFINAFGRQGDVTGSFARPKGVATDTYGNIYVTDALFNAVQVFDKDGQLLSYFGSQGRGKGQFWMPSGIFVDEENNIYVADSYNSRIQVFKLKGRSMK